MFITGNHRKFHTYQNYTIKTDGTVLINLKTVERSCTSHTLCEIAKHHF